MVWAQAAEARKAQAAAVREVGAAPGNVVL